MTPKHIIIVIIAGVAAALALLSASQVGAGAVPLLLITPLPVYIAALSFGTTVGAAASILAMIIAAIIGSVETAMIMGLAFSIPASFIGHQANLAQPNDDGSMEWFPLPNLFFNLSLILVFGIIALGLLLNYDATLIYTQMNEAVVEILRRNPPSIPMTDQDIEQLTRNVLRILPFAFAGIWLIVHVTNLYFAGVISRMSGMMPRPRDDIPATLNLPKPAIAVLLISIVCASFLSGSIQTMASVFAGVFMMAYAMLGLANMHLKARGNPAGIIFMIIAYAIIVILYLPLYLFAIAGILRNLSTNQTQTPPPNGT